MGILSSAIISDAPIYPIRIVTKVGGMCDSGFVPRLNSLSHVAVTDGFQVLYVFLIMEVGHAPNRSLQRHGPSQCGVDAAAVPGGHLGFLFTTAIVYFPPSSSRPVIHGPEHFKNALPGSPSECLLRTISRRHLSRMFGFPDSTE